jgi:hypothetical protein
MPGIEPFHPSCHWKGNCGRKSGHRFPAKLNGAEKLHCVIVKVAPNRELHWQFHFILSGLMRGENSFTIEPTGTNQVRFIDREIFKGLLIP